MEKAPKDTGEYGAEFWKRLGSVMGGAKPYAWASKVGIPKSTFSHCMNGRCILPLKHLLRVADSTGVSLKWLITGEGDDEEAQARFFTMDKVLRDLMEYARTLTAAKREMVRDIVKRIAEEEAGVSAKGIHRGNG